MATGALAFDPSAPGELVIPEMTYVRDVDGTSWVTVVGTQPPDLPDLPDLPSPVPHPARDLDGTDDAKKWPIGSRIPDLRRGATLIESGDVKFVAAVTTALGHIAANELQKVVLARKVIIDFELPVDVGATVAALRTRERSSTIFAVTSPGFAFVGASPELLVEREGAVVRSVPLAGTVRMTGDSGSDQAAVARLIASAKQNLEHRLVVDVVAAQLQGCTETLHVPAEPEVLWLRQMAHLATPIAGRLEGDPLNWPSALELAASLHPTPAVGGSPRAAALEIIAELEPGGRGLYAGPVGWVDANGNGQFVIGIRSCEVTGRSASVYAGAGIVAGSDPQDELAETSIKLDTMLGALSSG
jgi:isochorismate synthase